METIVAVSFDASRRAYDAVTKLQELDQQGQLQVHEARKQLRKERQEQKKEEIDHKLDELKAKFRKPDEAPAAS